MQDIIHTQIQTPIEIRKNLLRSTLDCLAILKSYENLKKIREEKKHLKAKLRLSNLKIKKLVNNIQKELPRLRTPEERKPTPPKERIEKKKEKVEKKKIEGREKLSQELFEIQNRLSKLEI